MCVPQNILCPPKIFASPFLSRYFKDNLLTKNSSRSSSSPADWVSGGAYWRITVKERVIYLGNFSQTIFGRCSAGEDAIYIQLLFSSTLQGFPFYPISLLYQFPTPDSISRGYPLIDLSPPLPLLFRIAPPSLPSLPEQRKTFEREGGPRKILRLVEELNLIACFLGGQVERYSVQSGSFYAL